ncbi:hypothetical protein [Neisseria sp. CCUG12390]|uniref:hypothetical protein n=1 Tax=Neisseria sp. CCUG12390 TaxID=3392035 RepID=UPI003A102755
MILKKCLIPLLVVLLVITACGTVNEKENYLRNNLLYQEVQNFPFDVSIIEDNIKESNSGQYNIKIVNKVNKKIQIIQVGKALKDGNISDLLKVEDFNNDGYLDILASSLYPSLQIVDTLYIFDPKSQKFLEKMDNILYEGTISIIRPGCIKINYIVRNGINYLEPEIFCWVVNKWKSEQE